MLHTIWFQLNVILKKAKYGYPWLPIPVFLGFPGGSDSKESACNAGDLGSIPGLGRPPGEGHGNPLQYACLENPHGQRTLMVYSSWLCKDRMRAQIRDDLKDWLPDRFSQQAALCSVHLIIHCKWKEKLFKIKYILSQGQEKYQQAQIHRWYHANGRKQSGTKDPLDEGERGVHFSRA